MKMNTEEIERKGIYRCGSMFTELGFIFREQPIADYGIDAIIETKYSDYPSGKMVAVQIKSGDSYFKEKKDDCIIYRGNINHYNYWINHSLPVVIVLYSPTTEECIWEVITKQTVENTKTNWKIMIPNRQTLKDSKEELYLLAEKQSDYERRLMSLVIAKKWMLETQRYGETILEVEEWINKSSGRGRFELKIVEERK